MFLVLLSTVCIFTISYSASTRGVYERKLFKLQSGPQAAPIYEPGEEEEEDDDEEDEAQEADEESK